MKRTQLHRMVAVVLGLLIVALVGSPAGGVEMERADGTAVPSSLTVQPAITSDDPIVRYTPQSGVNVIRINLREPRVRIRNAFPNNDTGGYQSLLAIANRPGVVAAINTDYGPFYCYSASTCPTACAVNRQGAPAICSDGVNYLDGRNVTNASWPVEEHRSWLGVNRYSDHAKIGLPISDMGDHNYNVIGGGPIIVENGQPKWPQWPPRSYGCRSNCTNDPSSQDHGVEINGELFGCSALCWNSPRPMTAVGVSQDGQTIWLAVTEQSKALGPVDMANLLISQGAWTAIRYDSGGSSQMWYQGRMVTAGDGRWIPAALLVSLDDDQPPPPPPCPSPTLRDPANGHVQSGDRTITFRWDDVNCDHNGFTFRVKTVPDMESDDDTVVNIGEGGTQRTVTFDSRWDNRDLYWSVRAANAPGGASWASARRFRISPNNPPHISFNQANAIAVTQNGQRVEHRGRDWTFSGTASDPENQLNHVDFHCWGNNCNETQRAGTPGYTWSYTRNGLEGHNRIHFYAYDNAGQRNPDSDRHYVDLYTDQAAPQSRHDFSGTSGDNGWYRSPVQVSLFSQDQGTGRDGATGGIANHFASGVREIRCSLDGGWQSYSGPFTVSSDGNHTVEYYAVDNVGNQEGSRQATFKIDATSPTAPPPASESHGVASGIWQKAHNDPSFTWGPSSDATSGVWGYQLYFGDDPNGTGLTARSANDRQYTPNPVRTGTYYLRGRTRDNAGNWSNWVTMFTFRYDGTPPENPAEAAHAAGIKNDTWQRITNLADFTWPVPHDEGSGIKGYYAYWGSTPDGTSSNFITANRYQSATPLCGTNEACTGYLRLRSRDNVDNDAEKWSTAFVLRYDNAPPTADFTFNGGMTQTTQTLVTLHITADDQGSGVREMRLSGDGRNWTTWEVYATRRPWTIPAISRQWWPVYLQVRDGVGLESAVVMHEIYLDVNPQQPRSENFRLFDHIMSAGAGEHASLPSGYTGRSTVGQVMDSARINSLSYTIVGGYEAGSQALPIEEPGHDEFTFINGIFASGTGADTLRSPLYEMWGTVGEVGLPNNQTTLNSSGFQHQPGFLAAAPPSGTPTPTPTPGPTPTPTPTPACEFPRISINDAALFTNDPDVTLSICAPNAAEMMLSNDGGFPGATWEPYAETKPWTITTYGQYVLPRFVYAAFKDTDGTVHGVYFDDIIYDPSPPSGTLIVGEGGILVSRAMLRGTQAQTLAMDRPLRLLTTAQGNGTVDVFVDAQDDASGLGEMQLSEDPAFAGATWEEYSALVPVTPSPGDGVKTLYARFRDRAGNTSAAANDQFVLDSTPPIGGIAANQQVVGPGTVFITLTLGAEDNLTGVTDMRLSQTPVFTDTTWQPYTGTVAWSVYGLRAGPVYVQYRDLTGNLSDVYSDTLLLDTAPPVLYVEVSPGETLTRTVTVLTYDELAEVATMRLSNDPLMIEGVVTLPYTPTVTWAFDERRVVWVQLEDSVGNITEPYPASMPVAGLADLDGNCAVNVADIMMVASRWRTSCDNPDPDNNLATPNYEGRYDLDHDCDIDIVDIMLVVVHWGETC